MMKINLECIQTSKIKIALIIVMLAIYIMGYFWVRTNKLLVHTVGFQTTGIGMETYNHSIEMGDFGFPMLTGSEIWLIADIAYWAFTPLRYIETLYWIMVVRQYKFGV